MRDPNDWPEDMPQDIRDAIQRGMDSAEAEYNAITKDAERYRKMRDSIGMKTWVIRRPNLIAVRTAEGMDEFADAMEATDANPQ